jgi:hypothetical protein
MATLLHFIGEGKWSDEKVLAKVREMVLPQVERHGAITIKCRNNFRSWPVAEMTATPVAAGFSGRAVASRRSLRITFSHSFEGLRRQNNDFAAFDANPPVLLPGLQFPVDGFASHTNQTPEILLGD